jgi:hypothetical protein
MKLTDRGRASQKRIFGADLLGVLSIRTSRTTLSKGFLAQAKLLGVGKPLRLKKLRSQCEDMLSYTPDSYVFLYDARGVRVVSALMVARGSEHPNALPTWTLRQFFVAHFSSFVGDERLRTPSPDALDEVRRGRARHALEVEVVEVPSGVTVYRLRGGGL